MMARFFAAGLLGVCDGSRLRSARQPAVSEALLENMHYDDFGLDQDTWLGLEDAEDFKPNRKDLTGLVFSNSSQTGSMPLDSTAKLYPTVIVMGLFNTGTNLLEKLLDKNFPGLAHAGLRGEALGLQMWKHVRPDQIAPDLIRRGQPNILRDSGAIGIAVIRDPLSWVQSMKKAPYDLAGCMTNPAWDVRGCIFPAPNRVPSTVWGHNARWVVHRQPFYVDNIESVWNQWNQQYHTLEQLGFAPHRTLVVSYEELLLDTHGALAKVAAVLGQAPPMQVQHVVRPAKNHGTPNGREAALRKLYSKSYMTGYNYQQHHNVCQRLNKPLMHVHSYFDCDALSMSAQQPAANATANLAASTAAVAEEAANQAAAKAKATDKGKHKAKAAKAKAIDKGKAKAKATKATDKGKDKGKAKAAKSKAKAKAIDKGKGKAKAAKANATYKGKGKAKALKAKAASLEPRPPKPPRPLTPRFASRKPVPQILSKSWDWKRH